MAVNEISNDSDPNPCPICLSTVVQDSYLDKCFHKFCYSCIVRWSNVAVSRQSREPSSVKCPVCKARHQVLNSRSIEKIKHDSVFYIRYSVFRAYDTALYLTQTSNFSIIYGYDGTSFQQHYVCKTKINSEFYTEAHRYRLKCYYTERGDLADKLNVTRYWKLHKYLQNNQFLPDWLTREFQAVMQEEDVSIVMHHVIGVIDSFRRGWSQKSRKVPEIAQEEFRTAVSEAVRPFFSGRTDRFINELELFLASGLNIDAFDEVYTKHLGWNSNETGEDDHDQPQEHTPQIPLLYIFDEDSD